MKVKVDIKEVREIQHKEHGKAYEVVAQIDDVELHNVMAVPEKGEKMTLKSLATDIARQYKKEYVEELMGEIEIDLDEVK